MTNGTDGYKEDGDETGTESRAIHVVRFHPQNVARRRVVHERLDSNQREGSNGPYGLFLMKIVRGDGLFGDM